MHVTIPVVSTNASDVTIVRWLAAAGDFVEQGQVLLEVATDKAAFELPAPGSGILQRIVASPKSVVPIGMIVAVIGEKFDEAAVTAHNDAVLAQYRQALGLKPPPPPTAAADSAGTPARAEAPRHEAPAPVPGSVKATPKVRRLARELQIDLEAVQAATGATVLTEAILQAYLADHAADGSTPAP